LRVAHWLGLCLVAAQILCAARMRTATQSADVIRIDAAISLTGKYAHNGNNTKNGYDPAARPINDEGGIKIGDKDYKLVLRYDDDESTPARAAELAERLIEQDGVKSMLWPYSSRITKAILPVIEKHRVPMIEANGAARELFAKGYHYIFAGC
jgi:branched-chain amino acid transport system substrate-binding protein